MGYNRELAVSVLPRFTESEIDLVKALRAGFDLAEAGRLSKEIFALRSSSADLLAACEELVAEYDGDTERMASEPGYGRREDTPGISFARSAILKARS